MGILFSNNFLIAEKTLLVEGPSDLIYFLQAVKALKHREEIDVDLNDLSIVDAGTAENFVAIAKVMLSEGRSVVAMLDGDKSGQSVKSKLEKAAAAEIDAKRLTIQMLPSEKSIEDIFADLKILQQAAKVTAEDLIERGIRQLAVDVDLGTASKKIKPVAGSTLGFVFDEVTKLWFEPSEKLSKLSTALKYEDLIKKQPTAIDAEALEIIKQTQILLSLRGEKSTEEGVFEEI